MRDHPSIVEGKPKNPREVGSTMKPSEKEQASTHSEPGGFVHIGAILPTVLKQIERAYEQQLINRKSTSVLFRHSQTTQGRSGGEG